MAVTPQTNTTLKAMALRMKKCESFALCGHVNPDGDCLGSQLALGQALEAMGKRVVNLLVAPNSVGRDLVFLPGVSEMVPAEEFEGEVEAFVACDVPTSGRMCQAAAEIQAKAQVRFTIDHHAVDGCMSEFNYVDPDAPATGMIAWELIKELGVKPGKDAATCAYAALMTDTGRFQYQNTTPEAFQAAMEMVAAGADPAEVSREVYQRRSLASLRLEEAMLNNMRISDDGLWGFSYVTQEDFDRLGAVKADAEPLIDIIRSIDGLRVALMLRDQGEGVRGSLRAKDDVTDVASLARHIGGGGHKAAAGFTFDGTLDEALRVMPSYLDELVREGEVRR